MKKALILAATGLLSFATSAHAQGSPRPIVPNPPAHAPAPVPVTPAAPTSAPTPVQPAPPPPTSPSTEGAATPDANPPRFYLAHFLAEVAQGNLELVAQRSNVSLAEAQIETARIFPDPQLTAGVYQYDVTQRANPTASVVALNVPIQIGGQRGARIDLANAELSASQSDLQDFL
ncbi:MAG: TolC family protein, partial [Polyangiaceae bacterium]